LAFGCGAGGLYVREHYGEAIKSSETLRDIVNSLIEEIRWNIDNCPEEVK